MPDRASIQVALPHHDAAQRDQRGGREPKFFGAEQSGDHDVATGFHAAIGLQNDATAKVVEHQNLVRLRDAQAPRANQRV